MIGMKTRFRMILLTAGAIALLLNAPTSHAQVRYPPGNNPIPMGGIAGNPIPMGGFAGNPIPMGGFAGNPMRIGIAGNSIPMGGIAGNPMPLMPFNPIGMMGLPINPMAIPLNPMPTGGIAGYPNPMGGIAGNPNFNNPSSFSGRPMAITASNPFPRTGSITGNSIAGTMPMTNPIPSPIIPGMSGMPGSSNAGMETIWTCPSCGKEGGRGPTPPSTSRCPHCGIRISGGSSGGSFGAFQLGQIIGYVLMGTLVIALIAKFANGGISFGGGGGGDYDSAPAPVRKKKKKRPKPPVDDYDSNYKPPGRN